MIERWMVAMVGGAAAFIVGLLGGLSADLVSTFWGLPLLMVSGLGLFAMAIGFIDSSGL